MNRKLTLDVAMVIGALLAMLLSAWLIVTGPPVYDDPSTRWSLWR